MKLFRICLWVMKHSVHQKMYYGPMEDETYQKKKEYSTIDYHRLGDMLNALS